MIEIWKDIKGYEGIYQVSNLGNVKRLARVTKRNNHTMQIKGKYLTKNKSHKRGYLTVGLFKNGKNKTSTIHRLVAKTFIPNPNNYLQVNHKDGNKQNNTVENLEWVTNTMNMRHARFMGLYRYEIGVTLVSEKLNVFEFRTIAEANLFLEKGTSYIHECVKYKTPIYDKNNVVYYIGFKKNIVDELGGVFGE